MAVCKSPLQMIRKLQLNMHWINVKAFSQVPPTYIADTCCGMRMMLQTWCTNSLPRLKTWKFNACLLGQNLGMSELSFIWLAMWQGDFWALCYINIFKRSSAGDWIFLLTTLHCLSLFFHHENTRNVVQTNPKFLKFSRGSMPPDPLRVCNCTAHTRPSPSPSPPTKNLATRLSLEVTAKVLVTNETLRWRLTAKIFWPKFILNVDLHTVTETPATTILLDTDNGCFEERKHRWRQNSTYVATTWKKKARETERYMENDWAMVEELNQVD